MKTASFLLRAFALWAVVVSVQAQTAQTTSGGRGRPLPGPNVAADLPVSVDPKTFTIGADDVLAVNVWREPDLSGVFVVRPDGKITIPLIGDLIAAGKTPEKLSSEIAQELDKSIVEPRVTVSLQAVRSQKYRISGEVARSGAFPLTAPTTVLDALTDAGGFREYANLGRIVILRGSKRIKFNYKQVIKGINLEQNILLQNGDHIFVP